MKKKYNPLALLGLLGLMGIVGLFSHDIKWFAWFAWFAWFNRYNKPTDERFFSNISKSALVSFVIAFAGLFAVVLLINLNISMGVVFPIIELLFVVITISFYFMFEIFERYGV